MLFCFYEQNKTCGQKNKKSNNLNANSNTTLVGSISKLFKLKRTADAAALAVLIGVVELKKSKNSATETADPS